MKITRDVDVRGHRTKVAILEADVFADERFLDCLYRAFAYGGFITVAVGDECSEYECAGSDMDAETT